jgi:hypothetical protein
MLPKAFGLQRKHGPAQHPTISATFPSLSLWFSEPLIFHVGLAAGLWQVFLALVWFGPQVSGALVGCPTRRNVAKMFDTACRSSDKRPFL